MDSLIQINNQVQKLNLDIVESLYCGNSTVALSLHSKSIYYGIGQQYNQFLTDKNMTVSPISIRDFLMSRPWESSTRNLKLNALIKIITNQPVLRGDPIFISAIRDAIRRVVPRIKIDKAVRSGDYLEDFDIDDLISRCNDPRMSFIMEFLFVTGCRISEMINIRLGDINLNGTTANIKVVGKGNKQRIVFAKKVLIEEIKEVFNSRKYLFDNKRYSNYDRSNLWRYIKEIGIETGYEFIHPHIFRHSCAMKLKKEGQSPDFVQQYLGHDKVETTLEYYYHSKVDENVVRLFN